MMGMGALKALKELSLCCPEDVALAVFDELPGNESYSPEVTVVAQPEYEIGYRGAKMLIGQIENGEPAEPLAITLNAELRIRESTRLRIGTTRSHVRE
ncbi:MAG: LacI family transcriptional regulator [Bryobacterales bacterium]|nr:LacI family transcriptional regulator [Bryobacterales bacterium]